MDRRARIRRAEKIEAEEAAKRRLAETPGPKQCGMAELEAIARGEVDPGRDWVHPSLARLVRGSGAMHKYVVLLYAAAARQPNVLEIGTSGGASTLALLLGVHASGKRGRVWTVCSPDMPVIESLVDRFGMRTSWRCRSGDSQYILPDIAQTSHRFSLVLVDGEHSLTDAQALMEPGGILLTSDILAGWMAQWKEQSDGSSDANAAGRSDGGAGSTGGGSGA